MLTEEQRVRFSRRGGGRRALGIALVVTGLVLFAQQTGYLPLHPQGWLWTLVPAVVGLCQLFEPGRRSLGLVLLCWGLLLCSHQLGWLSLKRSWPLMVVAAGAGMLVQGFDRRRPRWHHPEEN